MKRIRGISLIVLVITIIVIIILAGSVILSLVNNNPITQASKATYQSDVKNFQTELDLYKTSQFTEKMGSYVPSLLQADETSVTYAGNVDTSITMNDVIPSLGKSPKYTGQFQVVNGELIFQGSDINKQSWSNEVGIKVDVISEPIITILPPTETFVRQGTDIVYTVKFSSNAPLTSIDLIGNVDVLDESNVALAVQPAIILGTLSVTSADSMRQIDITVKTDNLLNGSYKLRIKSGAITNSENVTNTNDIISIIGFDVEDILPPENPIMSATPTSWTKDSVTVSVTYSEDSVTREYSFDATNWSIYTGPIVVITNNTTVYARGYDLAGNESGTATLTVANIDKILPTLDILNGGTTSSSLTIIAVASDTGGSSLNLYSYQYSIDNGTTWTVAGSITNYTFNELSSGTYECRVRVSDNAGNTVTSNVLAITTTALGTISISSNPTTWTNGSVTVTITYPTEIVTKEYSTNGSTWITYTAAVVITSNTTVYARGFDAGGNQTSQATITVANIDKIVPTVTATNGGVTTSSVKVNASASDTGGSSLNSSSYEYSKDDGLTWTVASSATDYTFSGLTAGTYQCRVRVSDNAGNTATSNAVALTTTGIGNVSMSSSPIGWTNGSVTVTITYPTEIVTKEYSTNGSTWITYTAVVVVTTNTTVYARGFDAGGNQTAQATITVANIDKTSPTVTATNGGVTTSSVKVNASASDTGGSSLNSSSYEYSKDDGLTWTVASSATDYTFSGLTAGTYQCRVRVSDNAGNTATSSAVALTTTGLAALSMSASPTGWTSGNVTVTITYPAEIVTKEYSTNGSTWITYTAAVVVTTNTTVYARGFDAGGNQTAQATITVANIDKTAPTVTATNGGVTSSSVKVNASASDTGGSSLNSSSYQYSNDNGTTWTAVTSATSYTFTGLITGTYQCRVRVSDNAGNTATSSAVALTTTGLAAVSMSASPTGWTNGNVTVTITYPAEIVTKQYSTNGTTWVTYTAAVVVSTNSTVYARGYDAGGNQTAQSTITVTNIEKVAPTVAFGTNGATNIATASTTVTVSDTGGSNINASTLQYVWDTQNTTTPGSGWVTFTNGAALTRTESSGTYYLWIRANDNAGNSVVTKTNGFTFAVDWNATKGVNKPKLVAGMTPIKWSGSTVITTTETDTAWYDYPNKIWANARTADGSMWVWIPRYEYRIPTPHTSTPQTILVNFKQNLDTTATSGYRVHPAFTFGSTQLTGIWVAKFEASGTTAAVDVKPGIPSLRNLTLSDIYTACRNMETNSRYGWGTTGVGFDTHFIKNTEWGLAAYLSNSTYGKNAKLTVNTDSSFNTGGGAGTAYVSNIGQSTTGTIYGIYDMAGGNWEYVAAYPNNGNSNLTTYASALVSAPAQYKNIYTASPDSDASNYANAATMYGDAIYETSASYMNETAWYGGYSYMIYGSSIAFVRGGVYAGATYSTQFSTNVYPGMASGMHGFRPVIAVATGL